MSRAALVAVVAIGSPIIAARLGAFCWARGCQAALVAAGLAGWEDFRK